MSTYICYECGGRFQEDRQLHGDPICHGCSVAWFDGSMPAKHNREFGITDGVIAFVIGWIVGGWIG